MCVCLCECYIMFDIIAENLPNEFECDNGDDDERWWDDMMLFCSSCFFFSMADDNDDDNFFSWWTEVHFIRRRHKYNWKINV